jgi:S1-C subfamily serine protease
MRGASASWFFQQGRFAMLMRTVLSAAAACLLSMSFVFAQERDRSGQNQYQSSQERSQKAFLGITVDATKDDAEYEGVVIQRLQSDSPAAQAGLKIGDILLRLDDTRLKEPRDLTNALS